MSYIKKEKIIAPRSAIKEIECKVCKDLVSVDGNTEEVLCPNCTIIQNLKLFGVPQGAATTQKKASNVRYPRGWVFMKEFVTSDGKVFHRGVEQEELFGTKKPTIIKEKTTSTKKITKNEKEIKFREVSQQIDVVRKKMIKLETQDSKKNKTAIKNLNKEFTQLKKQRRKYI